MTRSLRKSLLLWLLLPAALALITFLPLAYHLVHQPAMEALDQALADASLALVPHLEVIDGEPRFVFPSAAEQVLRADRVDDIYYLILGPNDRFIAGDAGLPHEAGPDDATPPPASPGAALNKEIGARRPAERTTAKPAARLISPL